MNTLSVYWSPWHRHPQYLDYIAHLQPAWIRHHQPQAGDLSDAQRATPQSNIMLRSWDIDDSDGARKAELYANPRSAAARLIDRWVQRADALESELRGKGLPYDRSKWCYGTWNEPDPAYIPQIVEGNAEAMRLAGERGMRLGVVCSSVGNFAKPGETMQNWNDFKMLEPAINKGGHILIAHEYWQREGPAGVWVDAQGRSRRDAGNLAWRHRDIPLNVPILIGEAGANGYIYGRFSSRDDCGWRSAALGLSPAQYAEQVREYIAGCDQRVQGVCLYMLDHHSDQWKSFDTLEASEQLLAVKDARPQRPPPFAPPPVHLPIIGGPASTPTPQAPIGIVDPLVAQAIIEIESGGQALSSSGDPIIRFEAHIFRQQLGNDAAFAQAFRYGSPSWTGQEMYINGAWEPIHTGNQQSEWAAWDNAESMNPEAAARSISMGAAQIMGFNHKRIGYPSAQAMLQAFRDSNVQVIAFLNFLMSDTTLWTAVRARDWRTIARLYNGAGNVEHYAALLERRYNQLRAAG